MLLILSVLRRTACLAPSLLTVTMFCAPFSPYHCPSGDLAFGRDLMTSPCHSKVTIILFPYCCIVGWLLFACTNLVSFKASYDPSQMSFIHKSNMCENL